MVAFTTVLTQNQVIKAINLNRPILYGEQVSMQSDDTVHWTKVQLGFMVHEYTAFLEL